MNRESEHRVDGSGLAWVAMIAAAAVVYVLSVGPIGALTKNNGAATNAARIFYSPVIWLLDKTPLQKPIAAYCNLWGVH